MKRIEYKLVKIPGNPHGLWGMDKYISELEDLYNELGRDGWSYSGLATNLDPKLWVFSREMEDQ